MPIDFARVPPRVAVPNPPRISAWRWGVLLVFFVVAGIGTSRLFWPQEGSPEWMFWAGGIGYSVGCWLFSLTLRLGLGYLECSQAVAENEVRDEIENDYHDRASRPLAVLGHFKRVATHEMAHAVRIDLSEHMPDDAASDPVNLSRPLSRALRMPGRPFYPSNALGEHVRHRALCSWVFGDLIHEMEARLRAMPIGSVLDVRLRLAARVDTERTSQELEELLSSTARGLIVRVTPSVAMLDISEMEQWHDSMTMNDAKLVVVIQLRDAISSGIEYGQTEGAAALLLRRAEALSPPENTTSALHIHRPAIGTVGSIPRTVENALKWGRSAGEQIDTIWMQGLTTEACHQITKILGDVVKKQDFDAMFGDCGDASSWLVVVHALEHAERKMLAQLLVTQPANNVISLVCRSENE